MKRQKNNQEKKSTSYNCTMVSYFLCFCMRFSQWKRENWLRSLLFCWSGHKRRLRPDLCLIMVISAQGKPNETSRVARHAKCSTIFSARCIFSDLQTIVRHHDDDDYYAANDHDEVVKETRKEEKKQQWQPVIWLYIHIMLILKADQQQKYNRVEPVEKSQKK